MDLNDEQNYILVIGNQDETCTFKARFEGREEINFVLPVAFQEMMNQIVDAGRDTPVQSLSEAMAENAIKIPDEVES